MNSDYRWACMVDHRRRLILDRANRMLRQSKSLRKVSESFLLESNDPRTSVKAPTGKGAKKHQPRRARKP
jgi:hypothetical protein